MTRCQFWLFLCCNQSMWRVHTSWPLSLSVLLWSVLSVSLCLYACLMSPQLYKSHFFMYSNHIWHNQWLCHEQQCQMGHTSDLMMMIRSSTVILTIIIRKRVKLNTHSLIYCMNDNWEIIWYLLSKIKVWPRAHCLCVSIQPSVYFALHHHSTVSGWDNSGGGHLVKLPAQHMLKIPTSWK